MSEMEFLGALEAEKEHKKWEQYCGTPCMYTKKNYGICVQFDLKSQIHKWNSVKEMNHSKIPQPP